MLHLKPILFIIGLVLSKIALFMYIPTAIAVLTRTGGAMEFLQAIVLTHTASFICLSITRNTHIKLGVRDIFILTTFVWIIATFFAALPFVFINHIDISDAYFETMSALTTTGSTVLSGLDDMPKSILLWRSILQWLGGIGFIVMSIAILPILGVGGMRLFQSESSEWNDKSSPRVRSVANHIFTVYVSLTLLCFMGYLLTGMNIFDAINHAMTTLSTGGFSTSDGSMNHFSKGAHWNATLFMFLGGLPFLLFIASIKQKKLATMFSDVQVKGFVYLVLFSSLVLTFWLTLHNHYTLLDALRVSFFNTISVITTTGFGLEDFTQWGNLPVIVFVFLMLSGACSGSTSGGSKIFRFQIAIELFKHQFRKLIHPNGVFVQKYNNRPVNEEIVRSVIAFGMAFFITIVVIAGLLSAMDLDPVTSLSAAITAVSNVGPGMGEHIGPSGNFAVLPDPAKWILSIGMLMGRLEILTIMVLFVPSFWKN